MRRSAGALPAPTVELLTRHAWEVLAPAPADSNRLIVRVDRLTPRGTERLNINGRLTTFKDKEGFYLTRMSGADAARVTTGDVLQIKRIDNITLLFHVEELGMLQEDANPPQQFARANEALRLPAQQLPQTPPSALESVERLRFDLLLRVGNDRRPTIEEMSFNFGHPRFWGDTVLIESSGLRPQSEAAARTRESARQSAAARPRGAQLSHAAESAEIFRALRGDARLDASELALLDPAAFGGLLSPVEENQRTFLPLGMLSILDEADIHGPLKTEIGDDRLGQFDTRLFVDAALVPNLSVQPATGDALMAEAFDRHYIQDKRLRGLHGLMFVGEAALVALPEAVQREWPGEIEPDNAPPPPAPPTPEPPDLSKFNDCAPPVTSPPLLPPPVASPPASSPPSAPGLPVLKKINPDDETDPQYLGELKNLIGLHQALLNFCHARRDAFGVLALPSYFEKRHCIRWQEEFRARLGLPLRRSVFTDARDIADLSYVAVYHPWLLLADEAAPDRLRAVPPDGAACGMIAARERERQVWVAPAGVPLGGVLGLAPSISNADWADLFNLQFNLVRREPRDFRAMSAHTLSDESIWLQVSVRRLLILIRKFVVERGMDFVFESNHERFRAGVRLMLEDALRLMYERGAFAGASPEQSFNIVTDASVNPPQSVDAGRFVAQIQVAPSQPLEFITVLLTRVGEDLLQAREA